MKEILQLKLADKDYLLHNLIIGKCSLFECNFPNSGATRVWVYCSGTHGCLTVDSNLDLSHQRHVSTNHYFIIFKT